MMDYYDSARDESSYEFPIRTQDPNKIRRILKEISKEYPHLQINADKVPDGINVSIKLRKGEVGGVEGEEVYQRVNEKLFQED